MIAGTIALVAGIAGSIYGGSSGTYLLQKLEELELTSDGSLGEFISAAKENISSLISESENISSSLSDALEAFFGASSVGRVDLLSLDLDVVANADGSYRVMV